LYSEGTIDERRELVILTERDTGPLQTPHALDDEGCITGSAAVAPDDELF
jgi:hypothetical protein